MIRPAQTFARILMLAMMASALALPGCSKKSKAVTLTTGNFEESVLNSKKPVLVDFWADWCAPCKMMDPIIRELAAEFEGRAIVGKVNADDYPEILARYGIQGLPTFLVFKDGELIRQISGPVPKQQFRDLLAAMQ